MKDRLRIKPQPSRWLSADHFPRMPSVFFIVIDYCHERRKFILLSLTVTTPFIFFGWFSYLFATTLWLVIIAADLRESWTARRDAVNLIRDLKSDQRTIEAEGRDRTDFPDDMLLILQNIADRTAGIACFQTRNFCSVTLKLIKSTHDGGRPSIHTLVRDRTSGLLRIHSPDAFSYDKNTAFFNIIERQEEFPYFASNDLERLSRDGLYSNSNPDWRRHYTKTVVLPIKTGVSHKKGRTGSIVGFLCVDSLAGDVTMPTLVNLLVNVAAEMYNLFRLMYILYSIDGAASVGWKWGPEGLNPISDAAQDAVEAALDRAAPPFDHFPTEALPATLGAHDAPTVVGSVGSSRWEQATMEQPDRGNQSQIVLLSRALGATVSASPAIIREFSAAFAFRAQTFGSCEADGVASGLEQTLSRILRTQPPKKLISSYLASKSEAKIKLTDIRELEFVARLQAALVGVTTESPITISRFEKIAKEMDVDYSSLIGAQFLGYCANKESVPY